jgi:predicted acylesterase/phospholipase RssA
VTTITRDLALTFAGGGNRAFYSFGLMSKWQDALLPRVASVACVSAGAAVLMTLLSGRRDEAREYWMARASETKRNFDWSKLLRGERPAPQGAIYRETMRIAFAEGGFERIKALPFPLYIMASAFPRFLPYSVSVALGLTFYSIERSMRRAPHPVSPRKLGFTPVVVDARTCETAVELADLVMASSATPPFTPLGKFRGATLLDGGMVDNAPAFVAERHPDVRRSVVFLARPYHPSVLGVQGSRLYLAPTQAPPIGRWDYTRPQLLDETVALGERESDLHRPALDAYLGA